MRPLHIFGDSHVLVLRHAWKALQMDSAITMHASHGLSWAEFELSEIDEGAAVRVRSDYVKVRCLDLTIRRSDTNVFSSVMHTPPTWRHPAWRESCPWSCWSANKGMLAVSDATLSTFIASSMRTRFSLLERLRQLGYSVAVAEAPRPLLRAPSMYKVRPDVLLEADRFHRSYVRHWLGERGIPVIAIPETTHRDGFTLPEYEAASPKDPHHGNVLFGTEMMTKVLEYAQSFE